MNDEEPSNADKTTQPIYNLITIQWRILGFLDGGRQPLNLGQKPFIWQDVCRKLHENNRNRTGGASQVPPGSSNAIDPTRLNIAFNMKYIHVCFKLQLNDVEEGGGLVFPSLKLKIKPEKVTDGLLASLHLISFIMFMVIRLIDSYINWNNSIK